MASDEILTSEEQKYLFLYNLKDEGYKNALKKEEVWLQISEVLGQEANVCKKRWKGLRDHYSRCKRAETLPSGSSASKRTRWRFYDQMSFLDNFQYCRRTWSNVFEVEESVIEVQGEEDEVHTATRQSRRKHDMIDDDFRFFLEETSSSLKETCDTFAAAAANSITIANANNVPNASASMFQGIAQIITAHKFNPQEEATLVGKITTYALNEIAKMREYVNSEYVY